MNITKRTARRGWKSHSPRHCTKLHCVSFFSFLCWSLLHVCERSCAKLMFCARRWKNDRMEDALAAKSAGCGARLNCVTLSHAGKQASSTGYELSNYCVPFFFGSAQKFLQIQGETPVSPWLHRIIYRWTSANTSFNY